jgi:hypothetical protein
MKNILKIITLPIFLIANGVFSSCEKSPKEESKTKKPRYDIPRDLCTPIIRPTNLQPICWTSYNDVWTFFWFYTRRDTSETIYGMGQLFQGGNFMSISGYLYRGDPNLLNPNNRTFLLVYFKEDIFNPDHQLTFAHARFSLSSLSFRITDLELFHAKFSEVNYDSKWYIRGRFRQFFGPQTSPILGHCFWNNPNLEVINLNDIYVESIN